MSQLTGGIHDGALGDRSPSRDSAKSGAGAGRGDEEFSVSTFARDESDAARIMHDAFKAAKGFDGDVVDTKRWSRDTEARVKDIVSNARAEVARVDDDPGRAAILLSVKRDLYLPVLEGVVSMLNDSSSPDAGAILDAVKDIFKDLCDDWRELADATRAKAAHAERERARAEASMSELYAVAKQLERDLESARAHVAALERKRQTMITNRQTNPTPSASPPGGGSPSSAAGAPPAPPSSTAPSTTLDLVLSFDDLKLTTGSAPAGARVGGAGGGDRAALERALQASATKPGAKKTPRWAIDSGTPAAEAAARRGVGRGGEGQFGPPTAIVRRRQRTGNQSDVAEPKRWSLKQLKDVIEDVCDAKAANDARAAKHKQPRETMHQHLYTFLNHKFGVKSIIAEWATSIVAAADKFADVDCEVAVFGRVLHNLVDEEFRNEQKVIVATVRELLRSYLRSQRPHANDDEIADALAAKTRGDLAEDEWLDMVRFMYGRKDSATIIERMRAVQSEVVEAAWREMENEEGIENDKPGTKRRTKKEIAAVAREKTAKRVPYEDFLQVCLFHGLETQEEALAPFAEAIGDMDCLARGTLNESQFKKLCERARHDLSDGEVEKLLVRLDPWNNNAITASTCYTALVPGLSEVAEGMKSLTHGRTSKEKVLGGVGHGELWNVSYEGRNFKGRARRGNAPPSRRELLRDD